MSESLFDAAEVANIKQRFAKLRPDSVPLWGKMSVAQMMAHCSLALETALGERMAPRMMLGRVLGFIIKPLALKDGATMKQGSPTSPDLIVTGPYEFEAEHTRLIALVDRFAAEGESGGARMHSFFGMLTPQEWSKLMHKHLDHHLRQFGA